MRFCFVVLFTFCFTVLCYSQTTTKYNCVLKPGWYVQKGKEYFKIKVGKKFQLEIDERTNTKWRYKKTRITDFEYVLKLKETNDKEVNEMLKESPINIKIKDCDSNTYQFDLEINYDIMVEGTRKKGVFKEQGSLVRIGK